MIADADIAWVDMQPTSLTAEAIRHGEKLKWVSTIYAGLDAFPLTLLSERGTMLTNGVGINALAVAEYAVMGVLVAAKRFDEVVRAHDRHEWPKDSPGKVELFETQGADRRDGRDRQADRRAAGGVRGRRSPASRDRAATAR